MRTSEIREEALEQAREHVALARQYNRANSLFRRTYGMVSTHSEMYAAYHLNAAAQVRQRYQSIAIARGAFAPGDTCGICDQPGHHDQECTN